MNWKANWVYQKSCGQDCERTDQRDKSALLYDHQPALLPSVGVRDRRSVRHQAVLESYPSVGKSVLTSCSSTRIKWLQALGPDIRGHGNSSRDWSWPTWQTHLLPTVCLLDTKVSIWCRQHGSATLPKHTQKIPLLTMPVLFASLHLSEDHKLPDRPETAGEVG